MNTIGLIGGLVFAVIMIAFLAKHTSIEKLESKFEDGEESM